MYKPAGKEIDTQTDSQSRLLLPLSTLNLASKDPPNAKVISGSFTLRTRLV
jgi:hypothetical protein